MKTEKELKRIGKFMSLVLRHKPEDANIEIDDEGWTDVKILLKNLNINKEELNYILDNNNKDRFSYNDNLSKVRANQGHSLPHVHIKFEELTSDTVPEFLFHGTNSDTFPILLKEGIKKMKRTHVHLSKDLETAIDVGKRKGSNVVIVKINAKEMINDNKLYISKNGVYLADIVPAKYLDKIPSYINI